MHKFPRLVAWPCGIISSTLFSACSTHRSSTSWRRTRSENAPTHLRHESSISHSSRCWHLVSTWNLLENWQASNVAYQLSDPPGYATKLGLKTCQGQCQQQLFAYVCAPRSLNRRWRQTSKHIHASKQRRCDKTGVAVFLLSSCQHCQPGARKTSIPIGGSDFRLGKSHTPSRAHLTLVLALTSLHELVRIPMDLWSFTRQTALQFQNASFGDMVTHVLAPTFIKSNTDAAKASNLHKYQNHVKNQSNSSSKHKWMCK